MKHQIQRWFQDSAETKVKFAAEHAERIQQVAAVLVDMFRRGNKLLLFGNGGSAMDASHMAAEFVGRVAADEFPDDGPPRPHRQDSAPDFEVDMQRLVFPPGSRAGGNGLGSGIARNQGFHGADHKPSRRDRRLKL